MSAAANAPPVVRVAFYDGLRDVVPSSLDLSWDELAAALTSFDGSRCSADPSSPLACRGRDCPAKDGPAWSPVDIAGSRADAAVRAVTCAVLDLDHVGPAALDSALEALDGYALAAHSTHSHLAGGPDDGCYRLVVPLSRPAAPAEWRRARPAVVAALAVPADPQCSDLSRLYFLPTARAGAATFALSRDGAPLDVEDALAAAGAGAPSPVTLVDAPPAPGAPGAVDLSVLRDRLAAARRAKARGSERERAQADVIRRVLDGESLAEPGARDATLLRATGMLAYWLPAGTPWEAAAELLRPSLSATDTEPEGLAAWLELARQKFGRQAVARAAADSRRAADEAAVRELSRAVAGRAAVTVADVAAASSELAVVGTAPPLDWESLLVAGKDGLPKACEHNARLYVACCPELAGTITWDEVSKRVEVRGGPLAGVPEEVLDVALAGWLQRQRGFSGGAALVRGAIAQVARENPRDPLAEYFGELAWDGRPRVGKFMEDYFSAEGDVAYLRVVSRKWLVSLVARALQPGCKVDTVLVLEGAQGVGKSTAFEALVGQRYFLDTALELGEKDTMQAIASSWLVELGELASLRRAETPRVNQFITSKVDRFRPPYGRVTVESPRRCVFVGTTNEDSYLRDRTGNRRYWPVRVGRPDVDAVSRDRDQVLAEAAELFRAGEPWWLDAGEASAAAEEAERRLEASAVEEAVDRWWRGEPPARRPRRFTMLDVAEAALRVDPARVDHRLRCEVGHAMTRLGFRRVLRREGDDRVRYYEPTEELLSQPQQTPALRARGLALVAATKTEETKR